MTNFPIWADVQGGEKCDVQWPFAIPRPTPAEPIPPVSAMQLTYEFIYSTACRICTLVCGPSERCNEP